MENVNNRESLSDSGQDNEVMEVGPKEFSTTHQKSNSKDRNFWAYYPLILVFINLLFLMPGFVNSGELGLMGVPFLFNIYIIISAIPPIIILLAFPIRIIKIIFNIAASLIFLPIIFIFIFFLVGLPVLSNQYQKNTSEVITEINNNSYIPLGVDSQNVLLPGNIMVEILSGNFYEIYEIYGFSDVFEKEIIEKKKSVTLITGDDPYTIEFLAKSEHLSLLNMGEKYRFVRGELFLNDKPIDEKWLWEYLDRNTLEVISGVFTKAPITSTKGSGTREIYFLPDNSTEGEQLIVVTPFSKCFDNKNKDTGCNITYGTENREWSKILYPGKVNIKVIKNNNDTYLLKANFFNDKLF